MPAAPHANPLQTALSERRSLDHLDEGYEPCTNCAIDGRSASVPTLQARRDMEPRALALMEQFAVRTGVTGERPPRRYLWSRDDS